MRAKRGFINFNSLNIANFKRYDYSFRSIINYQKKRTGTFLAVSKQKSLISEKYKSDISKASKKYKKKAFVTSEVSLNYGKTAKPIGIRMGKGKGKISKKILLLKKGQPFVKFREISLLNLLRLNKLLSRGLNFNIVKDSY
jgi:hypothetical protein